MAPVAAAPLYKVVEVRQTQIYDGASPAQEAFQIVFNVLGRSGFTVTIPESDFNPDQTQAAVTDTASRIAAALNLEGPEIAFNAQGQPIPPGHEEHGGAAG
jgi:hypothetical protein